MFLKLHNVILSCILLVFLTGICQAQITQPSNFQSVGYDAQYYFQQSLINPAFVGLEGQMNLSVNHPFRQIYNQSKPQNYSLLFQDGFESFEGGYGLSFVYNNKNLGNDKDKFFLINAIVSGGFEFGENWAGRVGLTVGVLHYTNIYRSGSQKGTQGAAFFKLNLDAGVLLTNGDLSVGFSVVQSNEPEFGFSNTLSAEQEASVIDARVNNQFIRAVYFQIQYDIGINNDDIIITPLMLLSNRRNYGLNFGVSTRNNQNLLYLELGSNVLIKGKFLAGIHGSFINSTRLFSIMLGTRINESIQVTASYDVPSKDATNYRNIEIGAGFFFGGNE